MESFISQRTPEWLAQLLHVKLPDRSLEELFRNCWTLGRVAETGHALLAGGRYHSPQPQLGERPYRATVQDMERFHALCNVLNIPQGSRITLGDVEHGEGWRIGLCLWQICDELRHRGMDADVPAFATPEEYARLRSSMPREVNRHIVQQFDSRGESPVKLPPMRAHLFAPAARPDARSAPPQASSSAGTPGRSSGDAAAASASQYEATTPALPAPDASGLAEPECSEGSRGYGGGGGLDILVSILSPEKNKPAHAQLLNAIMHADEGGAAGDAGEAHAARHAKRSLGLAVEALATGAAFADSGEVTSARQPLCANGTSSYLRIISPRQYGGTPKQGAAAAEPGSGGQSIAPLVIAAGAALAAVLVAVVSGGRSGRSGRGRSPAPARQGRW